MAVPTLIGFADRGLSLEGRSGGIDVWLNGAITSPDKPSLGHAEATTGSRLSATELTALEEFMYAAFGPY